MEQFLNANNPSSSDLNNNNDATEINDECEIVPINKFQDTKLDLTENAGSYWRYFFKPDNPAQIKVKCRSCSKEISRGKNQSTSNLLGHLESVHKKLYAVIKEARYVEKQAKLKPISLKPINLQKEKRDT